MLPLRPHLNWGGTTCPGARWPEWVPQLRAKAIQTEEDDSMKLLHGRPSGRIYVHGEFGKRYITPNERKALVRAGATLVDVPDTELKSIPNVEDIVKAIRASGGGAPTKGTFTGNVELG